MLLTAAMLVTMLSGISITAFAAAFNVDTLVECEKGALANDMKKVKDKAASGGYYIVTDQGRAA